MQRRDVLIGAIGLTLGSGSFVPTEIGLFGY